MEKGGTGIEFFQEQKGVQFKWNFDFNNVITRNKTKKGQIWFNHKESSTRMFTFP